MTDKKLTDGEIAKALECCSEENKCKECPYYNKGNFKCLNYKFFKDLLDLINRLQAENERLKNILICFMGALGKVRNIDDIESISQIPLMTELNKGIRAEIKAEAYKEFAERLKEQAEVYTDSAEDVFILAVGISKIDNLLKELMGENND